MKESVKKDWTTVALPKSMLRELDAMRRPYEPNYAIVGRLIKKVRR